MIPSLVTFNYSVIAYGTPSTHNTEVQLPEWLPIVVSILVVIIGVFLTYNRNILIEEKRRKYDLKKQTYFDLLSILLESTRYWDKFQKTPMESRDFQMLAAKLDEDIAYRVQLVMYKLNLCGIPPETENIINRLMEPNTLKKPRLLHSIVLDELLPAISKDLNEPETSWRKLRK